MATVTKRGESYKITVSCGYDMSGRQIRKHHTWTPEPGMTARQIEKELERQKVLFEEKCRTGQVLDGNIRFSEFAELWFKDYAEKQLRPKTLASYNYLIIRINAAIGHIRLSRLQPQHLLAFYDNLAEDGIREDTKCKAKINFKALLSERSLTKIALAKQANVSISVLDSLTTGENITRKCAEQICAALTMSMDELFSIIDNKRGLSPKTILHYHRLLSSILETAVQWQIIPVNPCSRVKAPRVKKDEPRYLDDTQAVQLIETLEGQAAPFRVAIIVLLFTGMRRSELLGLEWDDVDHENQLLHVRRGSLYLPEKGVFTDETKNESSVRAIKISPVALNALQELKLWQTEQKLAVGDQWIQNNRAFTSWNGKPLHPDTLSNWFRNFIAKTDLPQISIHSLRHTNASLQIMQHIPVSTVASRLGHASPATTMRIYTHAIKSADAAAAEILQDILSPDNNKTG